MRVCACFRDVSVGVNVWFGLVGYDHHTVGVQISVTGGQSTDDHVSISQCILQTLYYVQLVECDHPALSVCKVTRINADISKLMWSRSN